MLRGCSRNAQGNAQEGVEHPAAQHPPLEQRDHQAWAGGRQPQVPQALASAPRRGRGGKEGSLLPPGRTQGRGWGSLCAAVQQPQPRSLPGRWQRGCHLHPSLHGSACSKPGCRAGQRDEEEQQPAPLPPGMEPRGPGTPRSSGQGGGRSPTACGAEKTLDPCKANEAPAPPRAMSQAGIPVPGWGGCPKSSARRGGIGARRGEASGGEPRVMTSPHVLPSLPTAAAWARATQHRGR